MFYDWLYITAVKQNPDLSARILHFNSFSDIEFNPKKSLNCQARSAAIYVSIKQNGLFDQVEFDAESWKNRFEDVYREKEVQLSL
jgi:hypothetical protein